MFLKKSFKNSKNILITNHHGIGDNIMMTPSVRALKEKNPQIEIFLLVTPEYKAIRDIWFTNPYIEKVIISNLSYHPRFWNPALFYLKDYFPLKKEAIQVAKQFNIDKIVIIKQQYFPEFIEKKLHFLPKHRVDRIAYELGVKLNSFNYDIFPQKQHYKQAQVFLEGYNMKDSPLIGLHTMPSNAGPRTWKLKNVKLLSEYFHNRYGYKFIHFHNKKSYHLEKSRESINLNNKYVYSTYQENGEELDILTVAVLAKKCKAVIAIDSAIAYIANAVKTPLILLCHPKNPIEERMPRTGIISGINDENFTFDKVRKTLIETLNKAGYKYEN